MRKVIRASEEARAARAINADDEMIEDEVIDDIDDVDVVDEDTEDDELSIEDLIIENVDTISDRWPKYAERLGDVDLSAIEDDKLRKVNDILGKIAYELIDLSDIIYNKSVD